MRIGKFDFSLVCTIDPFRDGDGIVIEEKPQARYDNKRGDPLNKHGSGSFCRFRIPLGYNKIGVYAITLNGEIEYIGECVDLGKRFSSNGYGGISPKNCFRGGQPTNCKINKKVLNHTKLGDTIDLWFFPTDSGINRKDMERVLIELINPEWNG